MVLNSVYPHKCVKINPRLQVPQKIREGHRAGPKTSFSYSPRLANDERVIKLNHEVK